MYGMVPLVAVTIKNRFEAIVGSDEKLSLGDLRDFLALFAALAALINSGDREICATFLSLSYRAFPFTSRTLLLPLYYSIRHIFSGE